MIKIDRNMRVVDINTNNKQIGSIGFDKKGHYRFVKRSHTKLSSEQEYQAMWIVDELNRSFGGN